MKRIQRKTGNTIQLFQLHFETILFIYAYPSHAGHDRKIIPYTPLDGMVNRNFF